MNKAFSLLIKPVSADCNLNCSYCFYLEKAALYPGTPAHPMDGETLEVMTRKYLSHPLPAYSFNWQGGEPTLAGLDFFREAVRLQKQYAPPGKPLSNSLQTNGTLLNAEWAEFLKENDFLVGLSLDGPEEIHDHYRKNHTGGGSQRDVLNGMEHLRRAGCEFNFMVLVSSANVDQPRKIYRYLKNLGATNFFQLIPCVEWNDRGEPEPWSINGEQWGKFLCSIFREWQKRDTHTISIRNFDAVINTLVRGQALDCPMESDCRQYFVVEHNGDIYPCDFFVEERLKLGNIHNNGWGNLLNSSLYTKFGKAKGHYPVECSSCPYIQFCYGGCQKHRPGRDSASPGKSVLCEGIRMFYGEALPKLKMLAGNLL